MSENGIIGDQYGTELPETQVDQTALMNEKNMAKFSNTREYKKLKEHLEQRIEFYQSFLPNGDSTAAPTDMAELGTKWMVANAIIAEFRAVLDAYENAREVVKELNKNV